MINKICKCGKHFSVRKYRAESAMYCSLDCARRYREYGQNALPKIKKVCPCGKHFEVQPCFSKAKFCSQKCSFKYRDMSWVKTTNITKVCKCGKKFRVYPYEKDIRVSCSRSCASKFMKRKTGYKNKKGSLAKIGELNPNWNKLKEDSGLQALHTYIHRRLDSTKPEKCQHCGLEKKLEMANKSREYKRDLDDWLWLCKKCHHKYDGADKYLELGRYRKGKWLKKNCLNCGKEIDVRKNEFERKKYCSRHCLGTYMGKNKSKKNERNNKIN